MPPTLPPIANRQPEEDDWNSGVGFRILIVFLVVAALGGVAAWKSGMLEAHRPPKTFQTEAGLRAAVAGETPDAVIGLLGRPDHTAGDAWKDDGAQWLYFGRVYNRATDSYDTTGRVTFRGGRAR